MLRQRRNPPEYSSANRSNLKRLQHHLRSRRTTATTRWSATADEEAVQCNCVLHDFNDSSRSRHSSELQMMMTMMGGGFSARQGSRSSLGSCTAWKAQSSLMEKSPPPTPCTIRSSPASSLSSSELSFGSDQVSTTPGLSFVTAKQSPCIISNDGKRVAESPPEAAAIHPLFKNRISKAELREARYLRAGGRRRFSFKTTSLEEVEGGLPAAAAEVEDRAKQRNMKHCYVPSLPSSAGSQYYESSDADSMVESRRSLAAQVRARLHQSSSATKTRRKEAVDRLLAWKEARIMKFMNKLKEKEISIDAMAKLEMKKLEAKLENERDKGMEKMQGKIKVAQMKAVKKKDKQREAAFKRINMVTDAFERMLITGKNSRRLLFL